MATARLMPFEVYRRDTCGRDLWHDIEIYGRERYAFEQLTPQEQSLLTLRYDARWTFAQIATELALTPYQARHYVERADWTLRRAIRDAVFLVI